jgi:hypothetical protein
MALPLKGLEAESEPRRYIPEEIIKIDARLQKDAVSTEPYLPGREAPAVLFEEVAASPDKVAQADVGVQANGREGIFQCTGDVEGIMKDEQVVPVSL